MYIIIVIDGAATSISVDWCILVCSSYFLYLFPCVKYLSSMYCLHCQWLEHNILKWFLHMDGFLCNHNCYEQNVKLIYNPCILVYLWQAYQHKMPSFSMKIEIINWLICVCGHTYNYVCVEGGMSTSRGRSSCWPWVELQWPPSVFPLHCHLSLPSLNGRCMCSCDTMPAIQWIYLPLSLRFSLLQLMVTSAPISLAVSKRLSTMSATIL